ncbi:MAG: threonylcarbamoyl-AMP synthase [Bdellovibrionales bacterium]|nr:threonylcarbamoyl-AMP synthase [Bdellovibrionales bacterium]
MTKPAKRAQILEPTEANIQVAARILKQGGVVAMPTETVYGLAGNAFEASALSKIFLTKERPTFDPLIVHIAPEKATLADLMREQLIYPHDLSDSAIKRIDALIRKFWPGPLTLVLPKSDLVPDLATSGMETVAIRAPKHPVARALIRELGLGVCAPSANRFGRISPTSAADVLEELGDRIDVILDGGPCEIGLESTILRITEDGEPILLRPGVVTRGEIEELLKTKVLDPRETGEGGPQIAPGRLASHYAPTKPFVILPNSIAQMMTPPALGAAKPKKVGLLALSGKSAEWAETLSEILELPVVAEILSEKGDWEESARNLFRALRRLDASDADFLVAEPVPPAAIESNGIAYAIADRLKRAAGPRG